MQHQIVPHHTGTGLHPYMMFILPNHRNVRDLVEQHQPIEISGEKDVAATAEDQPWFVLELRCLQQLPCTMRTAEARQQFGLHGDAEGVVRFEVYVALEEHGGWCKFSGRSTTDQAPTC